MIVMKSKTLSNTQIYWYLKLTVCQECWLINMVLLARHGLWVILFDNLYKDCKKKSTLVQWSALCQKKLKWNSFELW